MADTIGTWLEGLGLGEFAGAFEENGVDLALLPELNNDDLKDMGVARVADRKKLLKAIAALETAALPAADSTTSAPETERRQVSILFADISGFTKLSGEVGAENIHEILGRYFDSVDDIVINHGGTVDKHIGDSVMAVFGAPIAHSDDAARAVRAALAIQEKMPDLSRDIGRDIQVHIGIASGQVVASGVGNDTHYTVTGESVNLASRLTDAASAGETFVSSAVHVASPDLAEWRDRGFLRLKGIADEVHAYAVQGLRSNAAANMDRAFIGRQAELQQVLATMSACSETGRGQTVFIRGEAGIGKTRLCEQLQALARERGFATHRTLVLDFGVGKGQDAINGLVRELLNIAQGSDKTARGEGAARALADGLFEQSQLMYINDLLDLSQPMEVRSLFDAMDNARRNQGRRETVAALLRNLSSRQPIVILVEDIHWARNLTLEDLAELARTAADHAVVLVMTSRIEGDPLDQSWRALSGDAPLTTIDLRPLRQEDAMALAAEYFDATTRFAQNCVERAEGNPLFLEQLLRNAQNASEDEVPGSVQSIVQARLDALDGLDKQALQAASVLGQRFSLETLRHLLGSPNYTCANLVERHLVRPEGAQFLFAHALVREGVYGSLLTARRETLHRAAAGWYRDHDPVLRAQHLDRAGNGDAPAAYLEAARKQTNDLRFEAALGLLDRGVELAADPGVRCDLLCLRGEALRDMGMTEQSISAFETALEAAPDRGRECNARIGMAEGLRVADRQGPAMDLLVEAESIAASDGLVAEQAQIHRLRGNLYFPLGNIDGCLQEHEKALGFARQTGSAESEALAQSGMGDAHYLRGHMQSSCESFQACVKVCQEQGYGRIEVANLHMIGWTRIYLLQFREAHENALAAVQMAVEVSHQRAEVLGLMMASTVEVEFRQFTEADEHLQRALALARVLGTGNFEANILFLLSRLNSALARTDEAVEYAKAGVAVVRDVGMTFMGPSLLARLAALIEDDGERRAYLAEAETILDTGCVAHNHIRFAQQAIDLSLEAGAWDEADRYADRLMRSIDQQSLAWPVFVADRGRALAAWGRGVRDEAQAAEIHRLRDLGQLHGLAAAVIKLDEALAGAA